MDLRIVGLSRARLRYRFRFRVHGVRSGVECASRRRVMPRINIDGDRRARARKRIRLRPAVSGFRLRVPLRRDRSPSGSAVTSRR